MNRIIFNLSVSTLLWWLIKQNQFTFENKNYFYFQSKDTVILNKSAQLNVNAFNMMSYKFVWVLVSRTECWTMFAYAYVHGSHVCIK